MQGSTESFPGGDIDFRGIYEEIYGAFDYNIGMEIEPDKTALVIVDMQPGLTNSQVGMAKAYRQLLKISIEYFDDRVQNLVIPNIAGLLEFFRSQQMLVAYIVTWSETDDLSDMPNYQKRSIRRSEDVYGEQLYRKWSEGMGIWDEIAPREHELVLPKRTGSAFASSMLPFCLQNAGIRTVVLTGCNTNGCVFETAVVGKNMGYEFVMASDATACFAPVLQNQAEAWIARHFGLVTTTDEAITLLKSSKQGA